MCDHIGVIRFHRYAKSLDAAGGGSPSRASQNTIHPAGGNHQNTIALVGAMFLPLSSIAIVLASCCRTCLGERQLRHHNGPELEIAEESTPITTVSSKNFPRILTVLTTYNQRAQYIKAYREVARDRADGYQPMIFVTSDEEDADPDGVIDYKFGQPEVHRLLAAVREAVSRYSGQFDWIAAGDDDTIFMYKRAMALLRNIDHTQPIAIGLVHGSCDLDGRSRGRCQCFTPEERIGESASLNATRGCCLDITRPCEVPRLPDPRWSELSTKGFRRHGIGAYEGHLYWPYGGTGFFISAGLAEAIQANNDGWEVCRNNFQQSNTDTQFGKCLISNGFTFSTFSDGFLRPHTGSQETIRDEVASNCQIIGVHAGIRHIRGDREYTPDDFKATLSKTWAEDDAQPWLKESSLELECPETWATISRWM